MRYDILLVGHVLDSVLFYCVHEMTPEHPLDELTVVKRTRDEYLQQRNDARNMLIKAGEALELCDRDYGLPVDHKNILNEINRARGIGGYEWPE